VSSTGTFLARKLAPMVEADCGSKEFLTYLGACLALTGGSWDGSMWFVPDD
jgi:hypothetical protein